jgi:hypothetical protein
VTPRPPSSRRPLAGSTCNNTLKGLPLEYNLEYGGVVVNLDKYQAAHPGQQPSWATWSDFITDAHNLAEFDGATPKANGLDIDTGWPQPVKHILLSQILQRGGSYWARGRHLRLPERRRQGLVPRDGQLDQGPEGDVAGGPGARRQHLRHHPARPR